MIDQPTDRPLPSLTGGVIAGFLTLFVAMGIGRFLYTPLLPLMVHEYALSPRDAGLIASLNYVGYLIGAFTAGPLCRTFREYPVLVVGLLLSALTTASTGLFQSFPPLAISRALAGVASGLAFVSASGMVLTTIVRHHREPLTGLYYGGVGGGIVVTGLAAFPVARYIGASGTWQLFSLISILCGLIILILMRAHQIPSQADARSQTPLPRDRRFWRVVVAYGLEGFGYIITGTFMVAAATNSIGPERAHLIWVVAGAAAIPSALFWSTTAHRVGRTRALVAALVLQSIGIVLPAVGNQLPILVLGSLLFGSTFMGIVTLALSEGASFAPQSRSSIIALMTGIYGFGQILGPTLASLLASYSGSYTSALVIASAAIAVAALHLLPDALHHPQRKPVTSKE